jgi:hypothetical protein
MTNIRIPTKKARILVGLAAIGSLALAACGANASAAPSGSHPTHHGTGGGKITTTIAPGLLTARHACRLVIDHSPKGFFNDIEQVHLVLTSYGKGEPVESQGDVAYGMAANARVWVVEVHAKSINWNHPTPAGSQPPKQPYTDFSTVMNAKTGKSTDSGECRCWPLPLSQVGTVVTLPADC